ncbi:MAG: hypothetical protein H6745_08385 [Deltaproteobacteria bacterium]|nr:hypothetical protein [Deltaproteobacteria bacterium]
MALADLPEGERDPAWSARAAAGLADARHAPWPRRGLLAACVALAVLALAFVIPEHTPPEPVAPPPVDAHFAPVERRLDRLERLGLATPEEVARLRQDLERLREEAREDGMSQAAWDGLDRLDASERQSLEKAEKALAQALAASKTLDAPRAGDPTPEEAQRQAAEERERRRRDRDRLKPKDPDAPEPGEAAAAREAARERLMERLSDERERERLGDLAGALSKLAEQAPGLLPALDPGDLKALERLLDAAKGLDGLDDAALEKLKELLEAAAKAGPGEGEGEGGEPGEGLTPEQIDALAKALEEGLEAGAARLTSGGADGARAMALAQALAKRSAPGAPATARAADRPPSSAAAPTQPSPRAPRPRSPTARS